MIIPRLKTTIPVHTSVTIIKLMFEMIKINQNNDKLQVTS